MRVLNRLDAASPTALAVAAPCQLTVEARGLLRDDLTTSDFFKLLRDRRLDADALRFLALALPKRFSVWWGCLAVWQMARPDPPPQIAAALGAAVQWVLERSEISRRAAEQPGRNAGLESSAGCLALAAFWSDGSMVPPELPAVPCPPHMTGRLIGNALLLAAVQRDALEYRAHYRQFLQLGTEIAQGENLWAELDDSRIEDLEENSWPIASRADARAAWSKRETMDAKHPPAP